MNTISFGGMQTQLYSESQGAFSGPTPETFREAEVLGLRLMQEGQHEEALKGKIPTCTAVSKGFDVIKLLHSHPTRTNTNLINTRNVNYTTLPVSKNQLELQSFRMDSSYQDRAQTLSELE
jgi:hypothetical protein